jgi:hypothetical protein
MNDTLAAYYAAVCAHRIAPNAANLESMLKTYESAKKSGWASWQVGEYVARMDSVHPENVREVAGMATRI